jgi:hypothetical protein
LKNLIFGLTNKPILLKFNMKKLLFISLFLPVLLAAQISSDETNQQFVHQVHEEVIAFTDRNLYLSGDDIWFSTFILVNGKIGAEQLSEVLYVELTGAENKVIAANKYNISLSKCRGKLRIPAETNSGAYFIRFYTKYQRNFNPASYDHIPITVVNTGLTLPANEGKSMFDDQKPVALEIEISTSKSVYTTREEVAVNISAPVGFNGWFCTSVARKGTIIDQQKSKAGIREIQLADDSVFHIPDVRGVSLSGFVYDETSTNTFENIPVYLSVFGTNNILEITRTGPQGEFLFALNDMYGLSDVFVTIDPEFKQGKKVLINTGFSNRFADLPEYGFSIDSSYQNLLSAMLVDLETRIAFLQEDIPIRPLIRNVPENYDFSIRLDDYIELATLEEVFYEIVPPVSVKSDNGVKSLSVANYKTQQVSAAGLVLLDNVPVFNANELLRIPPANIERIDVINRPYYLGDLLLESVISIKTKTGDFGGYRFPGHAVFLEYQTFEDYLYFKNPRYPDEDSRKAPLPDFRTTLDWSAAMQADQHQGGFSFYTSDARGQYEIIVRGVTEDGEVIFGKGEITVK